MSYLKEKISQFRDMAARSENDLSDQEIVGFLQELVHEGYGDGRNAGSILYGLEEEPKKIKAP